MSEPLPHSTFWLLFLYSPTCNYILPVSFVYYLPHTNLDPFSSGSLDPLFKALSEVDTESSMSLYCTCPLFICSFTTFKSLLVLLCFNVAFGNRWFHIYFKLTQYRTGQWDLSLFFAKTNILILFLLVMIKGEVFDFSLKPSLPVNSLCNTAFCSSSFCGTLYCLWISKMQIWACCCSSFCSSEFTISWF